jgi:hypothetical protein
MHISSPFTDTFASHREKMSVIELFFSCLSIQEISCTLDMHVEKLQEFASGTSSFALVLQMLVQAVIGSFRPDPCCESTPHNEQGLFM